MSATTKRRGMAMASLILGIMSVACFGLLAGIPAIILGHMAFSRSRKLPQEYEGGGLAIAGFIMGYCSLFTTLVLAAVLAGMFLPALAKAKSKAQSIQCINNLKQIGLGFRIWASDHNERLPFEVPPEEGGTQRGKPAPGEDLEENAIPTFEALAPQLGSANILICPGDSTRRPAGSVNSLTPENISYELETIPNKEADPQDVLARCPIHGHELLRDGSVHGGHR